MTNSKMSRPQTNTMKVKLKITSYSLIVHLVHSLSVLEQDFFFFFFNLEEYIVAVFSRNGLVSTLNGCQSAQFPVIIDLGRLSLSKKYTSLNFEAITPEN